MVKKPTIHSTLKEIEDYIPEQQASANYLWVKQKAELLRKKNSLRFKFAEWLISSL